LTSSEELVEFERMNENKGKTIKAGDGWWVEYSVAE
jgi:hypothetical protein